LSISSSKTASHARLRQHTECCIVQAAEYKTAQIRSNQIDQRLKPESGRGRDEEEIIGQLMISWPKRHTEPAGLLPQGTA